MKVFWRERERERERDSQSMLVEMWTRKKEGDGREGSRKCKVKGIERRV